MRLQRTAYERAWYCSTVALAGLAYLAHVMGLHTAFQVPTLDNPVSC